MIQFFGYDKCSTCQKAKRYLRNKDIDFKSIDITQTPPSKTLLKKILQSGDYSLKQLFNTSGQLYRQLNMKEKIKTLSNAELLDLLSHNGKLVKRPIITDGQHYSVGFNEQTMKDTWK